MNKPDEKIEIKADPNCPECRGEGFVYDVVDYGSTTARMESLCDCIEAQVPEGFEGEVTVVQTGVFG